MKTKKDQLLVDFGKYIAKVRRADGIKSQEEFGKLAKLHRTYIGMIERGEKNITLKSIQKIAKVFDRDIWDFFSLLIKIRDNKDEK